MFTELRDCKIGTMYSKKVVIGARLVESRRFFEESREKMKMRQQNAKNETALSLGIDSFPVKGSYADDYGTQTTHKKTEKADQKDIYWTAIGENAG